MIRKQHPGYLSEILMNFVFILGIASLILLITTYVKEKFFPERVDVFRSYRDEVGMNGMDLHGKQVEVESDVIDGMARA